MVLDMCLREHRDVMLADQEFDHAFKDLLQLLSNRKQPITLDLQYRVVADS